MLPKAVTICIEPFLLLLLQNFQRKKKEKKDVSPSGEFSVELARCSYIYLCYRILAAMPMSNITE